MKLYFIRHGKTQWNLESRYQGSGGDSPLLPESFQQMDEIGDFLKSTPFAHIYSSPIKRARITAGRIKQRIDQPQVPLTLMNRLQEFDLGQMEGKTFAEVERRFPKAFDAFRNHPDQYQAAEVGGESFTDVIHRMTPGIQQIIAANPGETDNVMVVSHGAALNAEINALLGVPLAELRKRGGLSNTSLTVLETVDNGKTFTLNVWNETGFLRAQPTKTDTI
ncbi:histidine phosphatase family protein [Levilactobacillus bambusae]|uniref:Histidine phosphatase family protein n=1 Tax=Levilactobacillus bambusae TaxID=2024736 RepID=A0A2V1N0Q2_9LACO|nr:histidine phosphatase family protein [Levilactobacillus bambusae]PWG00652.1 histidine phosphatase family protein [Levilactobacillus bambusae]